MADALQHQQVAYGVAERVALSQVNVVRCGVGADRIGLVLTRQRGAAQLAREDAVAFHERGRDAVGIELPRQRLQDEVQPSRDEHQPDAILLQRGKARLRLREKARRTTRYTS